MCIFEYPNLLNMAEKLAFTLSEIAQSIGVHKETVRRRMEKFKDMFNKQQRKRIYSPTEVEFIKSLFHDEIKPL